MCFLYNVGLTCASRPVQDGYSSLMAASEWGHLNIVELLLDRRANINAKAKVMCT